MFSLFIHNNKFPVVSFILSIKLKSTLATNCFKLAYSYRKIVKTKSYRISLGVGRYVFHEMYIIILQCSYNTFFLQNKIKRRTSTRECKKK